MLANGFVHLFRSVGLIKEGTIGLVLGNVINMMTSYFQALGKAVKSLVITVLRNAALFIPGVVI